jgi:hypothetical protein
MLCFKALPVKRKSFDSEAEYYDISTNSLKVKISSSNSSSSSSSSNSSSMSIRISVRDTAYKGNIQESTISLRILRVSDDDVYRSLGGKLPHIQGKKRL